MVFLNIRGKSVWKWPFLQLTFDLQMTANNVRKAEKIYRKCNPKSLLTATNVAEPSIKHWVLGEYILKNNENTEIRLIISCISSIWNGGAT